MVYKLPASIETNAKYIITDSRNVLFPNESIFFAIKGVNTDGHRYLKDLYSKGVREFVIELTSSNDAFLCSLSLFENSKIYIVPNSIIAMQQLVANKRHMYNLEVIAITGSNGKTIIKEWLAHLLTDNFNIVKSPKSYNSQLGVPLSVWQMSDRHTLGIFEAGISQVGEMENLEKVIQPTIGIFSNIGSAHGEYFKNDNEKIQEKLKLFLHVKKLIFCRDDKNLTDQINNFFAENNKNCELISWSMHDGLPVSFHISTDVLNAITFKNCANIQPFVFSLADKALLQNLCHCIVAIDQLGIPLAQIAPKIAMLKAIDMRLELKEGINNTQIIDDSYNNDFVGLKLAIEFLNQQKRYDKKVLILSDIQQADESSKVLYEKIAKLIQVNGITKLIAIGPVICKFKQDFLENSSFYDNTEHFLEAFDFSELYNSSILIKGARSYAFEQIVNRLQAKNHETFLEINLDAIVQNLYYYKQKLNATTKVMAMVKAFAYGSGNKEVASLLQYHQVDYLGVAFTDEGIFLRENGISLPIMVMNPTINDYDKIVEFSLEPEIFSMNKLYQFVEFMESQTGLAKIHIKFDTGMHRLGFQKDDLPSIINILINNPNIIVASIFSHLVGSENANFDDFSVKQAQELASVANEISTSIGYKPIMHILNTSGIARFSNYQMDMVRLGIGLYGIGASDAEKNGLSLVSTLKSTISQIKEIEAGETVGYGRTGKVNQKSKIATIAIGYADGYNRRFGNGVGGMEVNGVLCPTIGNICMDMTMIDITKVEAKEGAEVIVFGKNPSAYLLADQIGTIPYEILTNIGERVKRVFYKV